MHLCVCQHTCRPLCGPRMVAYRRAASLLGASRHPRLGLWVPSGPVGTRVPVPPMRALATRCVHRCAHPWRSRPLRCSPHLSRRVCALMSCRAHSCAYDSCSRPSAVRLAVSAVLHVLSALSCTKIDRRRAAVFIGGGSGNRARLAGRAPVFAVRPPLQRRRRARSAHACMHMAGE